VVQEDNLVNQRIGWVLWSNAIFFALFAGITTIISGKGDPAVVGPLSAAPIFVALVGVVCTLGLSFGISAALNEIGYLCERYISHPSVKNAKNDDRVPNLVGHRNNHPIGKLIPWFVPIAMGALWALLILLHYFEFRK
jgi:hypothetical protein